MFYRLVEAKEKETFLKLLLDETICDGKIAIPNEWIKEVGGIHSKLQGKRKYELLLRIAQKHGFAIEPFQIGQMENFTILEDEPDTIVESLKTDCYVLGRYSKILQENGYFDDAVSAILQQSMENGCEKEIVQWLEEMIKRTRAYDRLEETISPVLIYKGTSVCNNILNVFAEQFGQAMEKKGICVEYFDEQKEPLENLTKYIGRHFRAIFGVQTYLFQIKMADGNTYLHDKIKGPKLHLILDHPIWMRNQMEHNCSDFYVLSHDRNYMEFVNKYYKKRTLHFPIPGIMQGCLKREKIYDLTFVGSMGDYRRQLGDIKTMERKDRFLANRFLLIMRKEKELSAEKAFEKAFQRYRENYAGEDILDIFYRVRKVIYVVMDYYRYQILKTILNHGIELHVFGDFWKNSVFANYSNLICHESVTVEESLKVYAQSKISLNIMSWHKDGFTERVSNIMLANTVLLSDETTYLNEKYTNGKDVLLFSLDRLQNLPLLIETNLQKEAQLQHIAENGFRKTLKEHTWEYQTDKVLKFLEKRQE